ncbi:hypothetical protein DCAR_0205680 [Daucus carota subsp. sativus]|uniref:Uncharacterized protein n=1 Tax=Daucus carota subsp. sativus TaxID=79200 RepID=A0AAF1AKE1_DAUCS|nr:hypothetical protein DCAR_0205680 [Daucus carota subsp. sativus]
MNPQGDFYQSRCKSAIIRAKQIMRVQRIWQQSPSCLRPIHGCCYCDRNSVEIIANVFTSIPFAVLRYKTPRYEKNLNSKLYALSLIGVGVASSLYHASRRRLRIYLRWDDYATIATAVVGYIFYAIKPKLLMAALDLVLSMQPLMVSVVYTRMMEHLPKKTLKDPKLKMALNVRKMSSLLGGALFIADDALLSNSIPSCCFAGAIGVST